MISLKTATGSKSVKQPKVRTVEGVDGLKNLAAVRVRNGANVNTVWSALAGGVTVPGGGGGSVIPAPILQSDVYGTAASGKPTRVTSDSVPVSIVGGSPPYTYVWTRTDAGSEVITVSQPQPGVFLFFATVAAAAIITATYTVTITDAHGASIISNTITVTLENTGSYVL